MLNGVAQRSLYKNGRFYFRPEHHPTDRDSNIELGEGRGAPTTRSQPTGVFISGTGSHGGGQVDATTMLTTTANTKLVTTMHQQQYNIHNDGDGGGEASVQKACRIRGQQELSQNI